MKIDEGIANKTTRINKRFSISLILPLMIFMISGSTTTTSYAAAQTLPSCTDPTGQNLRCMMVISTLPPPPNALQCQETSGQLLPCSYAMQNLSNGEQIVAITVYVPASYVFTGYGPWTIVKKVVHETETRIVHEPCPNGQTLNPETRKCVDIKYCPPPTGYHIDSMTHKCIKDPPCQPGWAYNPITGKCEPQLQKCERADSNAVTDLDKNLRTKDCDMGGANEHGMTPPVPPSTCKDNTTCQYVNTTKSLASSGGSGTGSRCVNNCTGTPPPVDCTKNPTDPSCIQSLTPSTTKTCPDGSVIDASATCPTQSPPSASSPPPVPGGGQGGPENTPSPPSSGSGGSSGGSSSGSSGGGGSGGSSTQP
jgi:uncharacterized membrane protein YgcG